eukprot:COSAG01_NODE_2227_length_8132_cov_3.231420_1_plen_67_part_10
MAVLASRAVQLYRQTHTHSRKQGRDTTVCEYTSTSAWATEIVQLNLHVQLYKVQQLRAAARSQWSEF